MKRSILMGCVAVGACLCMVVPLTAAELPTSPTATQPSPGATNVSTDKPAEACLSDLHTFGIQMEKDGYWLGGAGYGFGYPTGGSGYGYDYPPGTVGNAQNARPGYEVRQLVASATILARHGQQQQCEDVLSTTRDIYKLYMADMHTGKYPETDIRSWRTQQIGAAQPVTVKDSAFRSDELLGTDVRNAQGDALGSVNDIVMSPQMSKVVYLVIGQGGIFGIDEKYVPIPWEDFKVTPSGNLLVLDTTKATMEAAPQVTKDQFATPGTFDQESQKVDAYWKAHIATKKAN